MKAPAFQFYASDFLVGVMGMSNEDVGIYIRLLAFQWERGGLPVADTELRALVGSRKAISPSVLAKIPECPDGFRRNARLEAERAKQEKFRESRASNAHKRWKSKSDARASPVHEVSTSENDALRLQSSSSSSDIPPTPPAPPGADDDSGLSSVVPIPDTLPPPDPLAAVASRLINRLHRFAEINSINRRKVVGMVRRYGEERVAEAFDLANANDAENPVPYASSILARRQAEADTPKAGDPESGFTAPADEQLAALEKAGVL